MNKLKVFEKEEFGLIRVQEDENKEPLFCLSDVCKALELTNAQNVKNRLNKEGIYSIYTLTNGGYQDMLFINEQNLYKAIFQSRKKSAEKFVDWVTGEVLPSIRKTGRYDVKEQELKLQEKRLETAKFLFDNYYLTSNQKMEIAKQVAEPVGLTIPMQMKPKHILKSATELLAKYYPKVDVKEFNKEMYLSCLTEFRKTKKGKRYRVLKSFMLDYGQNVPNPYAPGETMPRYYDDMFEELIYELYYKWDEYERNYAASKVASERN